ncbi:MAG: hypothetical protein E7318_08885 [Clostridiales bacterium]|nr:hypothetical protein [Clostridiales bacterium]
MKTPLTKEKLQNHFTYSLWKYVLLAVVAILGWNLVYSMTAYHAPEEKKVVMGVYSFGSEENINAYMEKIRVELMPDMEEMYATYIAPDATYGDMILSTRIAARECDIYVLPRTQFQSYSAQGAFMALEEVLPDLIADLEAAGVSLNRGYRALEETGEKHQYGIPCADLPGILPMLNSDTSDMYISIFTVTGNDENVIKFFDQFIRDMMLEPTMVEVPAP